MIGEKMRKVALVLVKNEFRCMELMMDFPDCGGRDWMFLVRCLDKVILNCQGLFQIHLVLKLHCLLMIAGLTSADLVCFAKLKGEFGYLRQHYLLCLLFPD